MSCLTLLPLQSSVYFVQYSYGLTFVTAEAPKKTALGAHDNKPKKAPKRAAPKKKNVSDSDEDMFAVSKKKVC
jgi:hypothetical protein